MVSTVVPAAAVVLPSGPGLSAAPTEALSSPAADKLATRTPACWPAKVTEPACDNSGMLLLSDGAVLLLMETNEASDLHNHTRACTQPRTTAGAAAKRQHVANMLAGCQAEQ